MRMGERARLCGCGRGSRWAVLVGIVALEAIGGNPYAFAVYAPQLQALFSWSNAAIAAVGGVGNVGLYLSLDAGFFYDSQGPASTAVGGALFSLLGYALLWAAAAGLLGGSAAAPAPPAALVALASFTLNHGAGWIDTAAVSTAVRAFPRDRGLVVGLLKSFFGLSASLLTLTYSSVFKPNAVSFLLFLVALVPGVTALAAALLRVVSASEAAAVLSAFERRKLACSALGLVVLAAYIALVGVLQSRGVLGAQPLLAGLLLPLLLAQALLALPGTSAGSASSSSLSAPAAAEEAAEEEEEEELVARGGSVARGGAGLEGGADDQGAAKRLLPEGADAPASSSAARSSGGGGGGGSGSGASLIAGLLSVDLLLFCLVLFAGTGAGLTLINNLGALAKSLGADKDGQDVYVIVLSVSNCMGRLLVGVFSDVLARRLSRPWVFVACVVTMAAAQLTMAFATLENGLLFVGVAVTGAAYGSFWSLGPSLVADRFGVRSFASLYNVVSLWTAAASFLFSAEMAGAFYAARTPAGAASCVGVLCFQDTFLVLAGLCSLAAAAAALLAVRLRDLYEPGTGVARDYAAWAARNPAQARGTLARAVSRSCAPRCCCACGRALLLDDDDDDESGEGGAAGRPSRAFDGDVSMAFLGDEDDVTGRRSVVSTRSAY